MFRFRGHADLPWVLLQMGRGRRDFARRGTAAFWKLCGSGAGTGFTGMNPAVWAVLAVWPDAETARAETREAPLYVRWRSRAEEAWSIFLTPLSARGRWSGATPFTPAPPPADGPLAVLTRATLRASAARRFWDRAPGVQAAVAENPDVLFRIGIGEVPVMQQVTFSVWPDTASMARFARGDGPHGRAVRAVREGGWFREELYARFAVAGQDGTWGGADPLTPRTRAAA